MKLFTHNMLTSRCIKGVLNGYPLELLAKKVIEIDSEFRSEFIVKMIPKLDWKVFVQTANKLGYGKEFPESKLPNDYENDEEFLKNVYHALFEVDVVEGELICPETGRIFPISNGIPNMLVDNDK